MKTTYSFSVIKRLWKLERKLKTIKRKEVALSKDNCSIKFKYDKKFKCHILNTKLTTHEFRESPWSEATNIKCLTVGWLSLYILIFASTGVIIK